MDSHLATYWPAPGRLPRRKVTFEGGQERAQVRRSDPGRLVHARHVQRVVGVRDDVAEARGANETIGEIGLENPCAVQAPERVGVALWRGEGEAQAGGDGQVDYELDGLPQVQDHGIGGVAGRLQVGRLGGQPRDDPGQMPVRLDDTKQSRVSREHRDRQVPPGGLTQTSQMDTIWISNG